MNLTNHIILHIYNNLGISSPQKISLISNNFLLSRKISFEISNDKKEANLWGAEISINDIKFKIICGDFSSEEKEYAVVVKLDNCPTYGCYLSFQDSNPIDGLIAFALKENEWLLSNISTQATFLAGMENLKELGSAWNKISKYDDLIENIKSLVIYHDSLEGFDEG